MICVTFSCTVKPGHEAEVAELFRIITEHSRTEPGNLLYMAHRIPDNPAQIFVYAQYADKAALEAHHATPYYLRYIKEELPELIESQQSSIFEPLLPDDRAKHSASEIAPKPPATLPSSGEPDYLNTDWN